MAEGWRICRQVRNISAILEKRASNTDEGQRKERYITNIESARKVFHTSCALQLHSLGIRHLPSMADERHACGA